MQFPSDHDPIWIDWSRSPDGGLRFLAYTNAEGEPFLGCVRITPLGEMLRPPNYSPRPLSFWYHTELFRIPPVGLQLYHFTVRATGYGLIVQARRVPNDRRTREERAVSWMHENPTASF